MLRPKTVNYYALINISAMTIVTLRCTVARHLRGRKVHMHFTILLMLICLSNTIQAQNRQKAKINQIEKQKLDSVKMVLEAKIQSYSRRIDSTNSAQYQRQLERSLAADSAKDTYYGTVFSGIAVVVTVLVVFIGYNVYASRRESERQIAELSNNYKKAFDDQQRTHGETLKSQSQQFNDLATRAKEFQEAYQVTMEDYLNQARQKLADIDKNENTLTKIEEIEKDLKRIQGFTLPRSDTHKAEVETISVDITGTPIQMQCINCAYAILYDPPSQMAAFSHQLRVSLPGNVKKLEMAKCPKCGTYNSLPPQYQYNPPVT